MSKNVILAASLPATADQLFDAYLDRERCILDVSPISSVGRWP